MGNLLQVITIFRIYLVNLNFHFGPWAWSFDMILIDFFSSHCCFDAEPLRSHLLFFSITCIVLETGHDDDVIFGRSHYSLRVMDIAFFGLPVDLWEAPRPLWKWLICELCEFEKDNDHWATAGSEEAWEKWRQQRCETPRRKFPWEFSILPGK